MNLQFLFAVGFSAVVIWVKFRSGGNIFPQRLK
jgi:hypothetical protein